MPTCVIAVTTPKEKIPDGFLLKASKMISKQLGKPESYVTIRLETDQMMCHGGSTDPCGSIVLYSLGALGSKNRDHAKVIGDFIEKELGIDSNRFYITFVDVSPRDCGYGKSTFG